ncbi:MAG: MFS transporter [Bacillota bacterium]
MTAAPTRLWNRNFRLLATGLLISYIGDAFFAIGIVWLALTVTGNVLVAGTLMAVYGLPSLLLGPVAGALVDTWNKRWIMIIADGVRGLIVLAIFGLARASALPLPALYAGVLLLSLCDTLYKPSLRVLVPTLVPDAALARANSFIQGSQQFALILGASIAGLVVANLGTDVTMLVNALSFVVSALALYLVRFPDRLVQGRKVTVGSVLASTWQGVRYAAVTPDLLVIVLLAFGMNLVLSPVNIIFPVYSRDVIGAGAEGFGWLSASIGLGMVLGNLVLGTLGSRLRGPVAMALGVGTMALAFVGLGLAGALAPALACVVLLGMAAPFVQVPMVTHLQRSVPVAMQGRVFATFATVAQAAIPLGAALAGVALHALPVGRVFQAGALGLVAVYGLLQLYRRLAVRAPVAVPGQGVVVEE